MYVENPRLQFLSDEDDPNGINPENLVKGIFLMEFLVGLQNLAFCAKLNDPVPRAGSTAMLVEDLNGVKNSGMVNFNNSSLDSVNIVHQQ